MKPKEQMYSVKVTYQVDDLDELELREFYLGNAVFYNRFLCRAEKELLKFKFKLKKKPSDHYTKVFVRGNQTVRLYITKTEFELHGCPHLMSILAPYTSFKLDTIPDEPIPSKKKKKVKKLKESKVNE